MLLKLYHLFRTDRAAAYEFVERDDLKIDRRLAVVRQLEVKRQFQFTEEEISIILRENNTNGKDLIRKQLRQSFETTGLKDALGVPGMEHPRRDLEIVVDDVIKDIDSWILDVTKTSWPGKPGPCAEHVSPAVVDRKDVDGTVELDFTVEGWLFTDEVDNNVPKLQVEILPAGSKVAIQPAVKVVRVDVTDYPRTTAHVKATLPDARGQDVATYDVWVYQNQLTDGDKYPKGGSRLAAAITVCEFKATFP